MIPDLHKFEEPNHKTCNFPLFYYVFVIETLGMVAMLQKVVPKTNALAAKSWRQQPFSRNSSPKCHNHDASIHPPSNEPLRKGKAHDSRSPAPSMVARRPGFGPRLSPDHWAGVKTAYSAHRAMGALRLQKALLDSSSLARPGPRSEGNP